MPRQNAKAVDERPHAVVFGELMQKQCTRDNACISQVRHRIRIEQRIAVIERWPSQQKCSRTYHGDRNYRWKCPRSRRFSQHTLLMRIRAPSFMRAARVFPRGSSSLVSGSASIRPAPPLRSCVQLLPLLRPHPHRQLGRHSNPVMGASRSLKSWSGGRPRPPGERLDRPTATDNSARPTQPLRFDVLRPPAQPPL